jgi:hypothetical protein
MLVKVKGEGAPLVASDAPPIKGGKKYNLLLPGGVRLTTRQLEIY